MTINYWPDWVRECMLINRGYWLINHRIHSDHTIHLAKYVLALMMMMTRINQHFPVCRPLANLMIILSANKHTTHTHSPQFVMDLKIFVSLTTLFLASPPHLLAKIESDLTRSLRKITRVNILITTKQQRWWWMTNHALMSSYTKPYLMILNHHKKGILSVFWLTGHFYIIYHNKNLN